MWNDREGGGVTSDRGPREARPKDTTRLPFVEVAIENRVNAVCPGSVEGPRIDGVIDREAQARGISPDQVRSSYERQSSMRTFVSSDDISNLILFV